MQSPQWRAAFLESSLHGRWRSVRLFAQDSAFPLAL